MEPWEELVETEKAYFACRMRLFAAGAKDQLELALTDPRGRAAALRMLLAVPVDLTMELVEDVFEASIGLTDDIAIARDVLRRVDPGWLSTALRPLLANRFEEPKEPVDWVDYRCAADLLADLNQNSLLSRFLIWAIRIDDPDVQEIVDDYRYVLENHPPQP
ncbi:hypothetical protein [Pseudofrankia asymbiotica]|uniref:hypothetical protein n=1 Tax=Pseudofrankia asymbiotica TaxID=1834516 RepID=UPI0010549779|nr:hypothetical protein [Pseudofrankia asymbiotica]